MSVPCPDCSAPLPAGARACPACGISLVGPAAERLWQVDQQLAALAAERGPLLARLRAGEPPATVPAPRTARSWSVQELLLGGGVVLVLVAAVIFVAVEWDRIGLLGQVVVMLGATAAAMGGSRLLFGRDLAASAEAIAVLACGLLVLDAVAVRHYGLFGTDRLDAADYWVGALVLLAAAATGGARLARRSIVYPLAAVTAGAVVPAVLIPAFGLGLTGAAMLAAATWLAGVTALIVARGSARTSVVVAISVAAVGWLWVATQTSLIDVFRNAPWDGGAGAAAALVATLAGLVLASRAGRLPKLLRDSAFVLAHMVVVIGVADVAQHGGALALTLVAVAASAVAVAGIVRGGQLRHVLVLHALAWVAGAWSTTEAGWTWPQVGAWLAAVAAAGAVAAWFVPRGRQTVTVPYSAGTAALAVGALTHDLSPWVRTALLCAATVAFAATAAYRRHRPEEAGLAAGALVAATLATRYAEDSPRPLVTLAVVLGVAGVLTLGYSALRGRGLLAVPGVLVCSAATWAINLEADVSTVEVYSLPLAALALGAGIVRHRRVAGAPSWTTVGPGLAAGLLPSAVAAMSDDALTRPLLVLLAGVAVAAAGVRLRWQSPVATGVLASVLVAVAQLGPYAVALPRFVSLGTAGAVLLALGFRYEQRRREAAAAASWFVRLD